MLANAMRGLATEFGLTVPKGIDKLEELLTLVNADKAFPEKARRVFTGLFDQCRALAESIRALEAEIVAHARQDEAARRLLTVPGIGPITASLIIATVVDISVFKSARHFAATLEPFASGVYVNVLGDEGTAGVRRAYSAQKLTRLTAVKDTYDPHNVFHLNQNIPPSGAAVSN